MSWIYGNVGRRLRIEQSNRSAKRLFHVWTNLPQFALTSINKQISTDKGRAMRNRSEITKHYLLASDFDQTLSFNDTGIVLSELLGNTRFRDKVAGLSNINLVQQGGELAYLLLHDPEYRCVRKEHLIEVGKRVPLKNNIGLLAGLLAGGIAGHRFSFHVISAAPEEVAQSALAGIVPPERIHGTRFTYD